MQIAKNRVNQGDKSQDHELLKVFWLSSYSM